MTDGIIQKIFNDKLNNVVMTFQYVILLRSLEQELIEKIKRELSEPNITTFGCNAVSLQTVLNKLIGDNQE